MEGGRREPEHSFPLPGLEKHEQPWLGMWEQQSLESLGVGIKRKSPPLCQDLSQQGWICAHDTPSHKSRDRTPCFPGAGTRGLWCDPRVPTGFECRCCRLNPAHLHCTGISLLWRARWVLSSGLRGYLKAAVPHFSPSHPLLSAKPQPKLRATVFALPSSQAAHFLPRP